MGRLNSAFGNIHHNFPSASMMQPMHPWMKPMMPMQGMQMMQQMMPQYGGMMGNDCVFTNMHTTFKERYGPQDPYAFGNHDDIVDFDENE